MKTVSATLSTFTLKPNSDIGLLDSIPKHCVISQFTYCVMCCLRPYKIFNSEQNYFKVIRNPRSTAP